jgi:uncharacterized protein (TIGR02677 family)
MAEGQGRAEPPEVEAELAGESGSSRGTDAWWVALTPGEEPPPGFSRNPRRCEEGHDWARRNDRRHGRPRHRCPAHDPAYAPRQSGTLSPRRRVPIVEQGEPVRRDTSQMPVFQYVVDDNAALYIAAMDAIASLSRSLRLSVRPEQITEHLLQTGHTPEIATRAASDEILDKLFQRGNLDRSLDTVEPVRLADWDRRRLTYHLSRAGAVAHRMVTDFLVEIQKPVELSRASLVQMADGLTLLQEKGSHLRDAPDDDSDASAAVAREFRAVLDSVFLAGETLAEGVAAFFASMHRRAANWAVDEELFLAYKAEVIRYIRDFVDDLCVRQDSLLSAWSRVDGMEAADLIRRAKTVDTPVDAEDEEVAADVEDAMARWTGLHAWLSGTIAHLRAEAVAAVARVVDAALRIADTRQQRVSRQRDWLVLARWFDDPEVTPDPARLFRQAFGPDMWFHLGGDPQEPDAGRRTSWRDEVALQEVEVRPAAFGSGPRGRVAQKADYREAHEQARRARRLELAHQERALARLVNRGPVLLSSLTDLEPHEFDALVGLLMAALEGLPREDGSRRARSEDGSATISVSQAPDAAMATLHRRRSTLRLRDLRIEVRAVIRAQRRQAS